MNINLEDGKKDNEVSVVPSEEYMPFLLDNRNCIIFGMLLYQVAGVVLFKDIRTVNGVEHVALQDAARALGLLESDDQWN